MPPPILDEEESDDEDPRENLQARINSGLENMKKSHQTLLLAGKDIQNNKKLQELLKIKDEPGSIT